MDKFLQSTCELLIYVQNSAASRPSGSEKRRKGNVARLVRPLRKYLIERSDDEFEVDFGANASSSSVAR